LAIIEILKPLVEFITSFIANVGYPGIFVLMILEIRKVREIRG